MKKFEDKPFAIIGVNSDRDLEALQPVLEENEITWRSFWNGEKGTGGPISTQWNVSSWPTIYILDAEGKIRYKNLRGDSLDRALDELVAEALGASADSEEPKKSDAET